MDTALPPGEPGGVAPARWRGWRVVRVRGRSMLPTLRPGDLLLVRGGPRAAPGDLVVVRLPGDRPVAVKRLVARVPDGWWVERDNPAEGVDSWSVGAVPGAGLLGRAVLRLHPRPRLF
ncbi:MAG: S24 family peptidase [Kineosporiaceae bacterium]